ncbi:MAG: (2Fe-2S)-binding protein [Candidatus Hydrogenedens sp.]|nr:(2Fe-2S)-binding protein [Candidatus Hydrogenedens sp.]
MTKQMNFWINGKEYSALADPAMRLLDLLRDVFHLTGTKEGCAEGECGACTVILDGEAVNSCLILAGQAEGCHITTIEGLSEKGRLSVLQQAFVDCGAIQCGFCTPGMILSAKALLDRNPNPTQDEIKIALSGNLCRCTGYKKIVEAVHKAAAGKGEA